MRTCLLLPPAGSPLHASVRSPKVFRLVVLAVSMTVTLGVSGCSPGAGDATGSGGSRSATNSGGAPGTGGAAGSGGVTGSGGATHSGGVTGSGGANGSGGSPGSGGSNGSGGATATGGKSGSGGSSGGHLGAAGASGNGGAAMTGQGGSAGRIATGGTSLGSGGNGGTGGSPASNGGTDGGGPAPEGPCDIFATGNAPCVAAHSTVRLMASAYGGPLYQVRRASDNTTHDIGFLAPSGAADSAAQKTFCSGTTCTISVIYDQSGKNNHLSRSRGGGEVCRHQDREAVADALPLTINGHTVYGIKVVSDDNGGCTPPAGSEGTGYRLDHTTGVATGDDAETEYMVTSGDSQAYGNSGCCFDYGNVETDDKDDGAATMEALYFGGGAGWGHGGGNGPWVMADMENGIFSGSTSAYTGNTSVPFPYVTAVLIGRAGGTYALMAGNAQMGKMTTMYDGPRPAGYTKMKKQGAIVLGTGGDNSDHGRGYFFEGAMTAGAASADVMNLVQANIVAAGYGK